MSILHKLKKAIIVFLDEKYLEKTDENIYLRSIFSQLLSKEDNPLKKLKDLEVSVNKLSDKTTVFNDKINDFNKNLNILVSSQEELLNMFDQTMIENEEEYIETSNNASEKKYGIN